jgi:hypothetical protein
MLKKSYIRTTTEDKNMKTRLRMKCKSCGYWNRIEVNKPFIEQETSEPRVKAIIPSYEPLKTETCKKCGKLFHKHARGAFVISFLFAVFQRLASSRFKKCSFLK